MQLTSLEISNFRAIEHAVFDAIGQTVVIAGPNGCGKTAVLDALRLLKSTYGGYTQNELNQFWSEFQVPVVDRIPQPQRLLRNAKERMEIRGSFVLSESERSFLAAEAPRLLRPFVALDIAPQTQSEETASRSFARDTTKYRDLIEKRLSEEKDSFLRMLDQDSFAAYVAYEPEGDPPGLYLEESPVLQIVFSTYQPHDLGVFELYGASRTYAREQLGNINVRGQQTNRSDRGQHALYQFENKYKNIKQEIASTFLAEVLAEKAGVKLTGATDLTATLQKLFEQFFPGKKFLGPVASEQGTLLFEVELPSSARHDIDDLSSGEKEILYGYLRLREMSPRNSIIIFDEPELHLNPRLIRNLPSFYRDFLGEPYGNQIILVTHSDAFLREAIKREDFDLFHMQAAEHAEANQAARINADEALERAVIDLVGEVADYKGPDGKVVIVEGGGDTEFDRTMLTSLFPAFAETVTIISGGTKRNVETLHELLEQIGENKRRFFAIRDGDSDSHLGASGVASVLRWERYHIENYLLDPRFILEVMQDIGDCRTTFQGEAEILAALADCASSILDSLVRQHLEHEMYVRLRQEIALKANRTQEVRRSLTDAVGRVSARVATVVQQEMAEARIEERVAELQSEWRTSLADGSWISRFPGREVLAAFVHRHVGELRYERFRNLILARMRSAGYEPPEMRGLVDRILSA